MLDLKGVHKNVSQMQFSGAGLGLGYRLVGMDMGFTSLDIGMVAKAYKNSWTRLILIDYGGTIVSNDNVRWLLVLCASRVCSWCSLRTLFLQLNNLTRFQMVKERSAPSTPTKQMILALTEICADKRNTVFVVSGKERHSLTKSLGSIPNLGLAAEHGMFISWPTAKTSTKRRWETLVPDTDRAWRSLAVTIMEVYTSRTHGSYIEETEMKVLWQYRDADPEFGYQQARELEDHLAKYLRSFAVDILHGGMEEGGYVEVRPKGVNKGVLAMHVIKHFPTLSQKDKIDFALVLGDDHCDEPMLSVMRQIGRRVIGVRRARKGEDPLPPVPATITLVDVSSCDNYVSSDLEMFTCTVGKKPSAAANYLHDVNEVQELFDSLVKVSTRDQRFHSSADLRSHKDNEKHENISLSERYATGLVKSMSWDKEQPGADINNSNVLPEVRISSSLKDYLGLGTIEDDDDDEAFFF
jgi:trehalose 6-phosphate synthase/phosphatase